MKRFLDLFMAGLGTANGVCASLRAFFYAVAGQPLAFFGWMALAAVMFACAYLCLEEKR